MAIIGTCKECGQQFEAKRRTREFCATACRSDFNNRRALRGVEIFDLFMSMRFDREAAEKAGVWNLMCRMASSFREEDQRERAGRRSWDSIRNVKERNPHLNAVVINSNAAGARR